MLYMYMYCVLLECFKHSSRTNSRHVNKNQFWILEWVATSYCRQEAYYYRSKIQIIVIDPSFIRSNKKYWYRWRKLWGIKKIYIQFLSTSKVKPSFHRTNIKYEVSGITLCLNTPLLFLFFFSWVFVSLNKGVYRIGSCIICQRLVMWSTHEYETP